MSTYTLNIRLYQTLLRYASSVHTYVICSNQQWLQKALHTMASARPFCTFPSLFRAVPTFLIGDNTVRLCALALVGSRRACDNCKLLERHRLIINVSRKSSYPSSSSSSSSSSALPSALLLPVGSQRGCDDCFSLERHRLIIIASVKNNHHCKSKCS